MAAMGEEESDLASQCMAFCQALASKGQTFTFTLNVGPSFLFSLDTKGDYPSTKWNVKKKSPSTLRRNARRRAEFLNKKLEAFPGKETETGIRQVEEEVAVNATPEKERDPDRIADLVLSPICAKRDDEDIMPSPLPTLLVCTQKQRGGVKCGETFKSEKDMKSHTHKVHFFCIEHRRRYKNNTPPVCPAPGVPSGRCIFMNLAYCRHKGDCICGEE